MKQFDKCDALENIVKFAEFNDEYEKKCGDFIGIALQLLEFHVQRKPEEKNGISYCWRCGHKILSVLAPKYCCQCGQAIDWSNEE